MYFFAFSKKKFIIGLIFIFIITQILLRSTVMEFLDALQSTNLGTIRSTDAAILHPCPEKISIPGSSCTPERNQLKYIYICYYIRSTIILITKSSILVLIERIISFVHSKLSEIIRLWLENFNFIFKWSKVNRLNFLKRFVHDRKWIFSPLFWF